jgi:sec-independent protein translocase protein TatB
MVVVFVVALLVLGPERLPRVARTAGQWVGRARGMFTRLRSELEREANFQELQDAQRELRQALDDGGKAVSESIKPVVDAVEAQPTPSPARTDDNPADAASTGETPANHDVERTER